MTAIPSETHPVQRQSYFDQATENSLLEDDAAAWRAICSILLSIVIIGLISMVLTVAVIL